jgi:hypothetical protein
MIKRLFYAVLAFWVVKKYVLPYFGRSQDEAASDEL